MQVVGEHYRNVQIKNLCSTMLDEDNKYSLNLPGYYGWYWWE